MKPEMIIFDYGGTLLYEPDFNWLKGEEEVFKHVIKNPLNLTAKDIFDSNNKIFDDAQVSRDSGFELHHYQLLKMKYEYNLMELDIPYEEAECILWNAISPATKKCCMPHVEEMLDYLKQQGIRTGVISNMGWSGNALTRRINTILPDNTFEFIITSSEYCYRKPATALFELALRKAGLSADKVWFCGDTFNADIVGAHNAGIKPVYYQGLVEGGPKRKPLDKIPDFDFIKISDWNELKSYLED